MTLGSSLILPHPVSSCALLMLPFPYLWNLPHFLPPQQQGPKVSLRGAITQLTSVAPVLTLRRSSTEAYLATLPSCFNPFRRAVTLL